MRTAISWLIIIAIIVLGFFLVQNNNDSEELESVEVELNELNSSGVSGEAVLEETENGLSVRVSFSGDEGDRPIHIHAGSCSELGDVLYPLNNVVNGSSETELEVTIDDLMNQLPLAINVHESADNLETYVACGDVEKPEAMEKEDGEAMEKDTDSTNEETASNEGDVPADAELESEDFFLVNYTDNGFKPEKLTIKEGDKVRFVNNSSGRMWVGSDVHPTHTLYAGTNIQVHCANLLNKAFDQCQTNEAGGFWEFTFERAGEHGYHNHVRAVHTGVIVVE